MALESRPHDRPPTKRDWQRLSRAWHDLLTERIEALVRVRDGLSSCIGCGCLSLTRCALYNPGDVRGAEGPGARLLSPALRRVPPTSNAG
jgi:MerR family redox-sensitive transcriptional activator SoxR